MALVGLDQRLLHVNGALCKMLGYTTDQLHRMSIPDITHPDDQQAEAEHKSRLLNRERSTFQMVKRYFHADGHVVWGQLSVSAVADLEGQPLYYIGQLEDITERRRTEEALQASEERFRALIEKSSDILTVMDGDGIIRFASPSAFETLGYPPEEFVGRSTLEFVHPDERVGAGQMLESAARQAGCHRARGAAHPAS